MRHEARLYESLDAGQVRCGTCQWRCRLNPDKSGACGMYQNSGGRLYNLNYARVSSLAADPIEKKPLYHFHPGSRVLSFGTLGCNFRCRHCQNWTISAPEASGAELAACREILPETAVAMALEQDCQGIAWTYNEPTIWFEYTLDTAMLCKESGLYTVYVTNGYATPAALDAIGPYLDAWRVDIKGFSDQLYKDLTGVPHWREILEVSVRAKEKWGMHVEVVTNVVPGLNDDDAQLGDIAAWIHRALGELTPWHVTRFQPDYQLSDLPATPPDTLERAADIGARAGLKFVYVGNLAGHPSETTRCPQCGREVIRRQGYRADDAGLKDGHCGHCGHCGADVNVVTASGVTP